METDHPGTDRAARMSAFAAYVAPAARRPQLWRLAIGLALCGAVYAGGVMLALGAVRGWVPAEAVGPATLLERPAGTLFLLASFAAMAAGPVLAAALLHRRGPMTLIGPAGRAARDFAVAASVVLVLFGLSLGGWALLYEAEPNLPWRTWLTLLPLTLLGVLVQTGAEEVLFRGYAMQQLAARFPWRPVWMGLPALVFGLSHLDPSAADAWWPILGAVLFGVLAADLTVATGSLGAAWGVHFANNTVALALLATDGTITGLARYVTPYDVEAIGVAVALGDAALLVVAWAVCRRLLAR